MTAPTTPSPTDHPAPYRGLQLVAAGSAYVIEADGAVRAGGIVAEAGAAARSLGARAFAATRVGMDRFGRELTDRLHQATLDLSPLQTDPDLVTPRRIERAAGARLEARMEAFGAFDNLQWDADLEALARSAEAIVMDACGRRHGQSRSTLDRLLMAAPQAARAVDFTLRPPPIPPTAPERLERDLVGNALDLASIAVVDEVALRTLAPAVGAPLEAARRVVGAMRNGTVVLLERVDQGIALTIVTGSSAERIVVPSGTHPARVAVVASLATAAWQALPEALGAAC